MTVLITRRVLRRTHLLRPDLELNNLVLYCLAVVAARHEVRVHCATVMSSHMHLVVTDARGTLPRFLHELHRLLALGVKVLRKWEGAVWDHEKTSVVELRTEQAVVEKIAYCLANPVAAGLVRRAHQWPGVTARPEQLGRAAWTARRPDFYFEQDNPQWPEVATLRLSMPELRMSHAQLGERVSRELARLETDAHREVQAKGWRFLGAQKIAALSPFDRAKSWEPLRSRNPSFAVGHGQREAFFEAVVVLRTFRKAYRAAVQAWRRGVRNVLFPAGTWFMAWGHAATIAPS
jgi:REP element-mobilizing transposase RayT